MNETRKKFTSHMLIWIVIIIGFLLRLSQYLSNRSLWLDEALISLNIINKNFTELFNNLDLQQGAPIGFLLVEKFLVTYFGNNEFILRLFPFFCGLCSLFLFYKLTKLLLSPQAVFFSCTFFSLSEALIYYSSEVKQYSSDVLFPILIFLASIKFVKDFSRINRYFLLTVIFIAPWFSFPSSFLCLGVIFSLIFLNRNKPDILKLSLLFALAWCISFGLLYSVQLRNLTTEGLKLLNSGYLPVSVFPPKVFSVKWLADICSNFISFLDFNPLLFILLFATGIYLLSRKERFFFLVFSLTTLIMFLCSYLQYYPMFHRFLLFLVPTVIIILSLGLESLSEKIKKIHLAFSLILILYVFSPLVINSYDSLFNHRSFQEIKPVLRFINDHKKENDFIYVEHYAQYALKYYAKRYRFNDNFSLRDLDSNEAQGELYTRPEYNPIYIGSLGSQNSFDNYKLELNSFSKGSRVWVLFSHSFNNKKKILRFLDETCIRLNSYTRDNLRGGSSVFLYKFTN